jgi:hypothetical protein
MRAGYLVAAVYFAVVAFVAIHGYSASQPQIVQLCCLALTLIDFCLNLATCESLREYQLTGSLV